MIAAILISILPGMLSSPSIGELESRPIPELWTYIEALRFERDSDMVKYGREGELNGFARARAERVLIGRIGLRPYPLGGGRYLIHIPEAGRGHVGVIDVSEAE